MPNNIILLHHGIATRAAWYVCLKNGRFSWKSQAPLQLTLCGNGFGKNGRSPHRNLIGQTRAEGKAHGMAQRPQEYLSVPLAALRWPSHSGKTPLCSPALSTVPLCTTWPCKGTTPLGRDPIISREGGGEGLQDIYYPGVPAGAVNRRKRSFAAQINQLNTKKNKKGLRALVWSGGSLEGTDSGRSPIPL